MRTCQVIVAVLGASNYTDVKGGALTGAAALDRRGRAGPEVPGRHAQLVVPDRLRSGVTSPHRYDPRSTRPTPRWHPITGRRRCQEPAQVSGSGLGNECKGEATAVHAPPALVATMGAKAATAVVAAVAGGWR